MRQYPQLEFDLALLRSNADAVISRCRGMGIRVCGVVKGVDGLPEAARVLRAAGAEELGTSRLEQVAKCRAAGVPGPWLLIRIPGLTELPDVVALCETSLQSEWPTLLALEEECLRQNKTHRVIVMTDLGDLREGFWDKKELVDVCERVERELPHVHLAGIGVNLTCYGSTKPTPEKMNELVGLARQVEQRIGRKLEIVSGGATSSFTLVHWGTMPAGVNHLRIGEAILLGKDLQVDWGIRDMDYLRMDALTLRAEVVEVKDKPTYPIGEFAIDAFGRKPRLRGSGHPPPGDPGAGTRRRGRAGEPDPPGAGADGHRRLLRPLHRGCGGLPPALAGGRHCGILAVLQPHAVRHGAKRYAHHIQKPVCTGGVREKMGDFGILIIGVVDTFFAFFVVAPMMLQAASLFGVQKQFAKAMVQEGVVTQEAVDRIHPKKQIAGVVISLLLLAVLAYTCTKSEPWGYICGGVGLVAGMLKYRALVQYNSETVKRFKNTYKDEMDVKKFNKFVETHF